MGIKLISLNIEGSKHLDRVIPFLKKEKADVVCLQEVFLKDFEKIKNEISMKGKFFPMTNKNNSKYTDQPNGYEGIAFLTNLRHSHINKKCYFGQGYIRAFSDAKSKEYIFIYSVLEKDGKEYTVGTTHFTWTPDGKPTKQQLEDCEKLLNFTKRFSDLILCGDFNAPRGGEVFSSFTEYFRDNLPKKVTNTLDPKLHRSKKEVVVDTIFSTPEYIVTNVKVVDGLSDHKAVIGTIEKI